MLHSHECKGFIIAVHECEWDVVWFAGTGATRSDEVPSDES